MMMDFGYLLVDGEKREGGCANSRQPMRSKDIL